MAAPSLTVVDTNDRPVTSWDNGVVQANNEGPVLTIIIWNNRGGEVSVADLKDANITTLDIDGRAISEVVQGKWTRVNVPSTDEDDTVWTPIGGTTAKMLRADGLEEIDGFTIKGVANDGNIHNATENYCTIHLKTRVPAGVSAGIRDWKLRISGYFV